MNTSNVANSSFEMSNNTILRATVLNSGWIYTYIPGHGFDHARPYFIGYYHDLEAKSVKDRLGWFLAFTIALILLIIASIVNVYVFYRRGVKRDFMMLTCILHIRNITFGFFSWLGHLFTLRTGWWEADSWTCATTIWLIWLSGGYGMAVEALISYERRLCITSNEINYKPSTFKIAALALVALVVTALLSASFNVFPYHTNFAEWIVISGLNNDQPVYVCGNWEFAFSKQTGDFDTSAMTIMYYLLVTSPTVPFLGLNYWKVFGLIRQMQASRSSGTNSSMTFVNKLPDWQRKEIYLMKLSFAIFNIFTITYIPAFIAILSHALWNYNGYQIELAWVRKWCDFFVTLGPMLTTILQSITPSHVEAFINKLTKLTKRRIPRVSTII